MSSTVQSVSDPYGEGTSDGLTRTQSRRQTLSRMDDILVETILSYLTFSEKVTFESVSKQFQRVVYNRQTELHLTRWDPEEPDGLNQILQPIEVVDYATGSAHFNNFKCINKKWLRSLLKKCNAIERLVLDCFVDRQDMEIIAENCPKLKNMLWDPIGLNSEDLDHIGRLCGHQFKEIFFCSNFYAKHWSKFLIHCTNLSKLSSNCSNDLSITEMNYLPKLEQINDYQLNEDYDNVTGRAINSGINLNRFRELCLKYSKTLKWLSVSSYKMMNRTQLDQFFGSICQFQSLKHLNVYFQVTDETEGTINDYLTQLATNCSNLEYLMFSVYSEKLKFENIFESLTEFHNLTELYIYINSINTSQEINGNVKCLSSADKLKKFTISFERVNEKLFDDISVHLPNLCELTIECESEITDRTISQLAGLKKLKNFYLNKYQNCNKAITDESMCALINGCPLIDFLCFGSRPSITSQTIQVLIDLANKYPKREIAFDCGVSEAEDESELLAIDMLEFIGQIPDNLRLDITQPTADDE